MKATSSTIDYYRKAEGMTEGGSHSRRLKSLPQAMSDLAGCVQGLFLYDAVAKDFYGFEIPKERAGEIHLRSTQVLLDRIIELDHSPLTKARPPGKRVVGRCHHFAVLTVAALRAHDIPARARCGFGAYFNPPNFEDHWLCEYWDGDRWVLADTQFDDVWVEKLKVRHDVLDVPRDQFLVAADAWQQCRAGELDPDKFGIEFVKLRGLWFIAGSLIRDLAALNKVELLPWDTWGAQPQPNVKLSSEQLGFFDQLAELTSSPDRRFEGLRDRYREDERVRVPARVFNGLRQTLEPVDLDIESESAVVPTPADNPHRAKPSSHHRPQ